MMVREKRGGKGRRRGKNREERGGEGDKVQQGKGRGKERGERRSKD